MNYLIDTLAQKWQRYRLPRSLKHMAHFSRHLRIEGDIAGRRADVLWRNRVVGQLTGHAETRHRYTGDCFVVGSGPSLANIDLGRIADWPTVGVNGTIVKFMSDRVSPTFYSITDPDFFLNRFELVRSVLASGALCCFPCKGLAFICDQAPQLLRGVRLALSEIVNRRYFRPRLTPEECDVQCEQDPELILHPTVRGQDGLVGFSRNLAKGMFCGQTVGYRGIQIAYHMGFRRVFLLGMDFGAQHGQTRFYESAENARPSLLDQHFDRYIIPCFEIVKSLCDTGEFQVFNCSLNSRLPESLVPKIAFDDALALCRQSRAA